MLVLIDWEHPVGSRKLPPKYGRLEMLLEEFHTFDHAREHVHSLKQARKERGRYRVRALDILTEANGIRAVPLDALNALIEAAKKAAEDLKDGLGYDDYPAQIDAIVGKLQPFIDLKWLHEQRAREAAEEQAAKSLVNIKLTGEIP